MSGIPTKYQKFEARVIRRTEIHEAPYNPRLLREGAEKRLRKKIKQVGLLCPLVWNQRTGNLVSGHQRLKQLDILEKYPTKKDNYELSVAVVDLDETTEKEMVVFFNNPSAQGEWDIEGLAALNLEDGIDFANMGFSEADVDYMFEGDGRFSELFQDSEEVKEVKGKLKEIKEERAEATERLKQEDDVGFYVVVVCESAQERARFMRLIGAPPSEQYVNAVMIERRLKHERT